MNRNRLLTILLVPVAATSLSGCGVNAIPTADENVKAKWADVQADYQRRSNLIPNIVATVKAAAVSEGDILVGVTNARASANRINVTGDQLSDPRAMANFARVQGQVSYSLQRLQEAYPQLKSQANFQPLIDELEGTENRIKNDIRDYNAAVQAYNTRIRTFPDVIGAKIFYGAKPRIPYQATTPNADQAPKVDFGTGNAAL